MELLLLIVLMDMFCKEEQENILEIKCSDGRVLRFPIDNTPEDTQLN